MFVSYVVPFLIYWLLMGVISYIVVDIGQDYFYGEVTPGAPWKILVGSLILASILTYTRSNFATMFTSEIGSTLLLAIAWSGVFILIYRFHPWHGLGLAMATLLIFAGMATLVVDSMLSPRSTQRIDTTKEIKTYRGPASGVVRPSPTPTPTPVPPPAK